MRKRTPHRGTAWLVVHDSQSDTRFDISFLPSQDRSLWRAHPPEEFSPNPVPCNPFERCAHQWLLTFPYDLRAVAIKTKFICAASPVDRAEMRNKKLGVVSLFLSLSLYSVVEHCIWRSKLLQHTLLVFEVQLGVDTDVRCTCGLGGRSLGWIIEHT